MMRKGLGCVCGRKLLAGASRWRRPVEEEEWRPACAVHGDGGVVRAARRWMEQVRWLMMARCDGV